MTLSDLNPIRGASDNLYKDLP